MTQKTPQQALAAYDALYKIPNEDRYIIDGDEAQVAADLAAIVRALPQHPFLPEHPITPTRIIESRRAGGAMYVQLAGTDEEQLQLVDSLREELEQKILGGDAAVVDAAIEAVEQHTAAAAEEQIRADEQQRQLRYAAHEAIHGDSKAVQQADEFLQTQRGKSWATPDFLKGIKATMEHLKRQPR